MISVRRLLVLAAAVFLSVIGIDSPPPPGCIFSCLQPSLLVKVGASEVGRVTPISHMSFKRGGGVGVALGWPSV